MVTATSLLQNESGDLHVPVPCDLPAATSRGDLPVPTAGESAGVSTAGPLSPVGPRCPQNLVASVRHVQEEAGGDHGSRPGDKFRDPLDEQGTLPVSLWCPCTSGHFQKETVQKQESKRPEEGGRAGR